jgi:FkbM family methyltransferase
MRRNNNEEGKLIPRMMKFEVTPESYRSVADFLPYEALPRTIQFVLFWCLHWFLPGLSPVIAWPTKGSWAVENLSTSERYYLPGLPKPIEFFKISIGYSNDMGEKYTMDNFVEIERGDAVVDVGAFVGAFSVWAARNGAHVLACEPSSDTYTGLVRGTSQFFTIDTIRILIYNEETEITMLLGADETDNSVIDIDEGTAVDKETVAADSLSAVLEKRDFGPVQFLKVDAEGAEPEVIDGAAGIGIPKIAVDCSDERRGISTFNNVRDKLQQEGYEVRRQDSMLFARLVSE